MNEIIVLDVKFNFGNVENMIHPTVLIDDQNMVLIDCGFTGSLPTLEKVMAENHLKCKNLTHVLITHQDHDHMGALFALKQKYPHIQVIASKTESPYISGKQKSIRLEQAEDIKPHLPEEQKAFGQMFCHILKQVQPVSVDLEVQDGDVFDWCGGCTIIGTPGHTPGHISIDVNEKKTIITGDAAVLENGKLTVANPQFTLDMKRAEASLEKILTYDAETMICYHGGIFIP